MERIVPASDRNHTKLLGRLNEDGGRSAQRCVVGPFADPLVLECCPEVEDHPNLTLHGPCINATCRRVVRGHRDRAEGWR
jgi:hypothetical protein